MGNLVKTNFNQPLTLTIEQGWTMSKIIEESQVPDAVLPFVLITVNGTTLAVDQWDNFQPRSNDRISFWIRPAGGDSGKTILRLVATIAVAIAAPYLTVGIGTKLGLSVGTVGALTPLGIGISAGIGVIGALLITALIPPPSLNLPNGQADQGESYFITGQTNQARPYQIVPIVYGRTKMIANLATSPQIFSAGQSSIFTALYDFGLGNVEIINVKAGDTRIEVFKGEVIRHYQQPRLAFDDNPSAGLGPFPLSLVDYPINSEDLNIALNKTGDVGIVGTAPDAKSAVVELFFPQGLAFYDDNGNLQRVGVRFEGKFRQLGTDEWIPWPTGTKGYAADHLAINVGGNEGPNPSPSASVIITINGGSYQYIKPSEEFYLTMTFGQNTWGVEPENDVKFFQQATQQEFPFFEFVSSTEIEENTVWEVRYKAPDQEGEFYFETNLASFTDAPPPNGQPFPAKAYRSPSFFIKEETTAPPPAGCDDVFCLDDGNETYVAVVYYSTIPTPQPYGSDNPAWDDYIDQLQYQSFEVLREGFTVVTNTSDWQDYAGTIRSSDSVVDYSLSNFSYKNTHYHALKRRDIVGPNNPDGPDGPDGPDMPREFVDWPNPVDGIVGAFYITGDETTQGRVSIIVPFAVQGEYELKVERISDFENDNKSDQYFSSCYWSRIATRGLPSSDSNSRYSILDLKRQHTMMELSFEAAETIAGNVQQISALVHSRLRWHDGERWQQPQVTSNPAWIVLDLLTGYSAQQNRYPYSLQDDECGYLRLSQIDVQSFIDFAAVCDELVEYEYRGATQTRKRYTCNTVISSEAILMETVQNILGMARAQLVLGQNGLMQIMMDVDRGDQVRQVFTPSNSWGFEAQRSFPQMPDALQIEFTSPELGYQKGEVIVYNPNIDPDEAETFETLKTFGCTNWHQASWWGGYQMAQMLIRMEEFKLNVMAESLVIQRGDVVAISQDSAFLGGGSHLINAHPEPNVIVLSEAPYVYDDPYYTIRTHEGIIQGKVLDIDLYTVTLDRDIDQIIYANETALCVIGQKDLVTKNYIVNSIRPKADLTAELTLVVYDERMYLTDDGFYPEWDAGGDGDPQDPEYGKYEVKNLQGFTYLDFIEQGYCQNPYSVSRLTWDVRPDDGKVAGFEIQWSRSGQTAVIDFDRVGGSTRVYEHKYQANSNQYGPYTYTVTPITQLGYRGMPMTVYVNKSVDRVPPDKPKSFYVSSLSDQIRFFWKRPDAIDIGGYQIYVSESSSSSYEMEFEKTIVGQPDWVGDKYEMRPVSDGLLLLENKGGGIDNYPDGFIYGWYQHEETFTTGIERRTLRFDVNALKVESGDVRANYQWRNPQGGQPEWQSFQSTTASVQGVVEFRVEVKNYSLDKYAGIRQASINIYSLPEGSDLVMPDDAVLFAQADCKAESAFVYGGWDQSISIDYPKLSTGAIFWIVCTDSSGNRSIPESYTGLQYGPPCPAIVEPFDLVYAEGSSVNSGRWGEGRWGIEEWGTDGPTSFNVLVWKDLFDPYSEISHYEIRHTPEENADSLFDDKANVHSILDNVPAGVERLNLTEIGFEDVSGTFFIRAVNKRMCSGPWNRCGLKDEKVLWGRYYLQQSIGFYAETRAPYSDVDIFWDVTGLDGYKVDRFKVTLYPQQYIPSDPSQLPETGRVNAVVLYEGTEPKCSVRFSHLANEDLHFGVITVTPYFYEEELIASSILTIPWQLELDTEPPEAPKSLRIL